MGEMDKFIERMKNIVGDPEKFVDMMILGAEEKGLSGAEIVEAFAYLKMGMGEIQPILNRKHRNWEEVEEASEAYWKVIDDFADLLQRPRGTIH